MTNQPLTPEAIIGRHCPPKLSDRLEMIANIKFYAAQQTAALQAEVAILAGQIVRLEADYKLATEEIKILKGELAQAELKASQRGKAWIELSSQNERLKANQNGSGWQPMREFQRPYKGKSQEIICKGHWYTSDGSMTGGDSGFKPLYFCTPQPPKEAT